MTSVCDFKFGCRNVLVVTIYGDWHDHFGVFYSFCWYVDRGCFFPIIFFLTEIGRKLIGFCRGFR